MNRAYCSLLNCLIGTPSKQMSPLSELRASVNSLMSVIFPYIGLFKDNLKNSIVNSVLICILNPIQAIMLVLFNISVLYMSFSSPERVLTAIYVFTFGGFAFCGLMNVTITNKMFDKVKKFTKRRKPN